MNSIKKFALNALIIALVGFTTLELISFAMSKGGLLIFNDTPTIYISSEESQPVVFWRTERDIWGAWHKPNSGGADKRQCIDVKYISNEVGARDRTFNKNKEKSRYLLLGDSFAEGFGINEQNIAKSKIEALADIEIFNFGTAGNFGPLQYSLIYENLASQYEHDGVIVFILPANDFTDNDYAFWKENLSTYISNPRERYRPYYRKTQNGKFDFFIPDNADRRNDFLGDTNGYLKSFAINHFWLTNAIRTLKFLISNTKENNGSSYSGYFDPTIEQQMAVTFFINKIINKEVGKVFLVAIPTPEDFLRLRSGSKRENMYWYKNFKEVESANKNKVTFIDLIDHAPNKISDLFLPCDGHWSDFGNQWAAEVIAGKFAVKNKLD